MQPFDKRGLGLVSCGFMGKALLEGWMARGIASDSIFVRDPNPSDWLRARDDLNLNADFPTDLAALVIATKPQILDRVLPDLTQFGNGQTVVVSIAAGAPVSLFETHLGTETPVVRVMPNQPAAVGAGVTALFANAATDADPIRLVRDLFETVGTVVDLPEEDLLHVVTGLSGSGPAYVFAVAEALAEAGTQLGIPADLARVLALQTVAGAGAMLGRPGADATALRKAVTSKGGTTAAGLGPLRTTGALNDLMRRSVDAARQRSVELSQ
ncbi:pyrroline-5-carboxylate reductase [Paracoccus stylophorae]|uniref:Pyrroline-5-carboxylate reductase n=1 Tax=Paracoccus stylophorae TaxID=659350 RepID=A0ABY7SZ12_9RHOB|nr:pyrroline-5-carboxylate reductase [Paracoccus stylophorae]WCR12269.1 pyrroline-5-carboxylate reductase [Paracoccus stylophorae]